MRFFSKDIEIYSCGRYNLLPPGANRREKNATDIAYCTHGKGMLTMYDRSYPIVAGQCFVLFPNIRFVMISDQLEPWGTIFASVTGTTVIEALQHAGVTPRSPVFPWHDRGLILNDLNKIIDEYGYDTPRDELRRLSNLYQLLSDLIALRSEPGGVSSPSTKTGDCVLDTISFMKRNYQREITVSELAQRAGLNRSYFSSMFRRHVGISPQQYLMYLRIRVACDCLGIKTTPVSSIARTVGYDPFSFSRVFRQVLGLSPSEYRALSSSEKRAVFEKHPALIATSVTKDPILNAPEDRIPPNP